MGYIDGFEYDLFISYAHNDNHPIGVDSGWVDQFHQQLENWLKYRRGLTQLKVWRDKDLDGNTDFNLAIKNRIKESVLFLVLNSHNYVNSEYCNKELNWFYLYNSKNPEGLLIGEKQRIINILLNNIPYQQWPKALGGSSGFAMHDAETKDQYGEFTFPNDDQFNKQLRKIVDSIEETMTEFRTVCPSASINLAKAQKVQIFVANVVDKLQLFRERLMADIQEYGGNVLNDISSLVDTGINENQIRHIIEQANFSIHIFDQQSNEIEINHLIRQTEIAIRSSTPNLIWVADDLQLETIEKQGYRNWLNNLRNDLRENRNHEFIHCSRLAFTQLVLQKIQEITNQFIPETKPFSYLIDTHQKDQHFAYRLANCLTEQGIDVDFNKESRDPIKSLENFENSLKQVRNLIIICGKVAPQWLQERVKRATKVLAEQLATDAPLQLENIWVYLTPENQGTTALPKLPPIIKVRFLDNSQMNSFDPQVVDPLLWRP